MPRLALGWTVKINAPVEQVFRYLVPTGTLASGTGRYDFHYLPAHHQ